MADGLAQNHCFLGCDWTLDNFVVTAQGELSIMAPVSLRVGHTAQVRPDEKALKFVWRHREREHKGIAHMLFKLFFHAIMTGTERYTPGADPNLRRLIKEIFKGAVPVHQLWRSPAVLEPHELNALVSMYLNKSKIWADSIKDGSGNDTAASAQAKAVVAQLLPLQGLNSAATPEEFFDMADAAAASFASSSAPKAVGGPEGHALAYWVTQGHIYPAGWFHETAKPTSLCQQLDFFTLGKFTRNLKNLQKHVTEVCSSEYQPEQPHGFCGDLAGAMTLEGARNNQTHWGSDLFKALADGQAMKGWEDRQTSQLTAQGMSETLKQEVLQTRKSLVQRLSRTADFDAQLQALLFDDSPLALAALCLLTRNPHVAVQLPMAPPHRQEHSLVKLAPAAAAAAAAAAPQQPTGAPASSNAAQQPLGTAPAAAAAAAASSYQQVLRMIDALRARASTAAAAAAAAAAQPATPQHKRQATAAAQPATPQPKRQATAAVGAPTSPPLRTPSTPSPAPLPGPAAAAAAAAAAAPLPGPPPAAAAAAASCRPAAKGRPQAASALAAPLAGTPPAASSTSRSSMPVAPPTAPSPMPAAAVNSTMPLPAAATAAAPAPAAPAPVQRAAARLGPDYSPSRIASFDHSWGSKAFSGPPDDDPRSKLSAAAAGLLMVYDVPHPAAQLDLVVAPAREVVVAAIKEARTWCNKHLEPEEVPHALRMLYALLFWARFHGLRGYEVAEVAHAVVVLTVGQPAEREKFALGVVTVMENAARQPASVPAGVLTHTMSCSLVAHEVRPQASAQALAWLAKASELTVQLVEEVQEVAQLVAACPLYQQAAAIVADLQTLRSPQLPYSQKQSAWARLLPILRGRKGPAILRILCRWLSLRSRQALLAAAAQCLSEGGRQPAAVSATSLGLLGTAQQLQLEQEPRPAAEGSSPMEQLLAAACGMPLAAGLMGWGHPCTKDGVASMVLAVRAAAGLNDQSSLEASVAAVLKEVAAAVAAARRKRGASSGAGASEPQAKQGRV